MIASFFAMLRADWPELVGCAIIGAVVGAAIWFSIPT